MDTKLSKSERIGKILSIVGIALLTFSSIGFLHYKGRSEIKLQKIWEYEQNIDFFDFCLGGRVHSCSQFSDEQLIEMIDARRLALIDLYQEANNNLFIKQMFLYSILVNSALTCIGGVLFFGRALAFINNKNSMNSYRQSGTFGIGYMSDGVIKEGAKVTGNRNKD